MDNLMEIAQQTMEKFNPETDSVDDFEKLPDGEYNCLLEDVQARESETTGNQWISFKFSVMNGDYENRFIFVNYFFTEKTVVRSIKAINKVAYMFGYQLPVEAFQDLENLAETLNTMAGNQAIVKQTTSKNDYTNYTVIPIA